VAAAHPTNDALLAIGRSLVSVLYSRAGKYRQDPALDISALPDFDAAVAATNSVPDGVLRTELLRARNRLEGALLDVGDAAARVATRPSRA
jgi:N-acetylated-alpha-linked acidic dipeptidase